MSETTDDYDLVVDRRLSKRVDPAGGRLDGRYSAFVKNPTDHNLTAMTEAAWVYQTVKREFEAWLVEHEARKARRKK